MAKFEKVLHGDLDEIDRKIGQGIAAIASDTVKRDSWTTTAGDVRCIFTVFEKVARKIWEDGEYKDQPHYSLSVALVDTGEEIRLCAITAGSNQALYFIPGDGPEGGLMGALKTTLEILDQII